LLQNEETQGQDPYELTLYSTWRLSYDKLDAPARSLLQICSLLHHEGISEELFKKASLSQLDLQDLELQEESTKLLNQLGKQDSGWSSWTFQKVVKGLRSHSLIEYDTQNDTYSIHPLVHHWSGTTTEGNQHMQNLIVTIIGLSVSWTFTDKDYTYRHTLLNHSINSTASLKLEVINSSIARHIGLIYSEQGRWKEAEALQVVAMEKMRQRLGDDHPDTITSMGHLAATYGRQGRWKDAEALQVVAMEKTRQVLGDDHPSTLTSMGNLAATYGSQCRWKDAEALEVVVMEKRKQVLGDDHPDTLTSMGHLAATYGSQGRWKDVEALEVVVIEKRKRLLGVDHPDTLMVMGNLAATYHMQGRLDNAEALEVVVLEKRKQVLGIDHPHTIVTMKNLASTYRKQGRLDDAEALEVDIEKRKDI